MRKILVTGGTVFVSRYIAEYYVAKGDEVYVLNRNTRPQSQGINLIQADRHNLGNCLEGMHFDLVIDTAYTAEDVSLLLDAIDSVDDYILISSSAVYPEHESQPFSEKSTVGVNKIWGKYGTNKIEAETALLERVPAAYILRPPYLYGPMNNVYREAFVFDCALQGRKFYLPGSGEMKLQFFHIDDLCRFMDIILRQRPEQHIFNVGNKDVVTVREWVEMCYEAAGRQVQFVEVHKDIEQRSYFSFYDYEYCLDVTAQYSLMSETMPLSDGLAESFAWYWENPGLIMRKPFIEFIDSHINLFE